MKNTQPNLVMRDYAHEEKRRLIDGVYGRTCSPREETTAEKIMAGAGFVIFMLLICFI